MVGVEMSGVREGKDFFISRTGADKAWAAWIGYVLDEAGYSVYLQDWDFRPGKSFVRAMQEGATLCRRTLAVLSPDYLTDPFSAMELEAALARDPTGADRVLVTVRVRECKPRGLLARYPYIDLVGLDEGNARSTLLKYVSLGRSKPRGRPHFPGTRRNGPSVRPPYPRPSGPSSEFKFVDGTAPVPQGDEIQCDVFLSHSHCDADWVERLADRLTDEHGLKVWLDSRMLVPGKQWQQAMARALHRAKTCAICIGQGTPRGWFLQEIQKALNLQAENDIYRVIPVLLPDAPTDLSANMPPFLDLRTWADFREGHDLDFAFHVLVCGIRGEPIGRRSHTILASTAGEMQPTSVTEDDLRELHMLRQYLHESVFIEYQQKILSRRFGGR